MLTFNFDQLKDNDAFEKLHRVDTLAYIEARVNKRFALIYEDNCVVQESGRNILDYFTDAGFRCTYYDRGNDVLYITTKEKARFILCLDTIYNKLKA